MGAEQQSFQLEVSPEQQVSALWWRPAEALAAFVFAHGAGTGMQHPSMNAIAERLLAHRIATLRHQFPYRERGLPRPDPPALCAATVRAAVSRCRLLAPELPCIAGGRSFGARMTSQAQAAAPLPQVRGLALLGFPLHPAGRPSSERAQHLAQVHIPMLFLQGTRDALAERSVLEPVIEQLGARARLHRLEGADHSFHLRASARRSDEQLREELASAFARWLRELLQ